MATVVLERVLATPASAEDLHKSEKQAAWCMSIYGVEPKLHYLSKDGLRVVCIFEAPDAESMRQSARQAGFEQSEMAWSSTVHNPPGSSHADLPNLVYPESTLSVVERSFDEPVQFDDIQSMEDRASSCLDLHRVRFVRTYFSLDKRRMLCLYEAPDAESVRLANREAGLPLDRVWAAQIVLPALRK